MDSWWEKVDLTLTGYIGGDEHPNKPPSLKEHIHNSPLYNSLKGSKFSNLFRIITGFPPGFFHNMFFKEKCDWEEAIQEAYYKYFGLFKIRTYENMYYEEGKFCDRCSEKLNILNAEILSGPRNNRFYNGLCMDCVAVMEESKPKFFKGE